MSSTTSLAPEELGSSAQRERRKRILDATITLASDGGYDAVQMRSVAEAADVALGTLYRYFPSKVHLLVSALGREFDRLEAGLAGKEIPGDTAADRVIHTLKRTTRGMQGAPKLTEALTRAFMFADASVATEINVVSAALARMVTRALHPDDPELNDQDAQLARVVGDVWLAALVGWVTGRASAQETGERIEIAVRLLLRD